MVHLPWNSIECSKKLGYSLSRNLGTLFCNWNKYARTLRNPGWIRPLFPKYYSNNTDHGRQLGGFEYKEEEGPQPFKSLWRKSPAEKEGFWKSKLSFFNKKKFSANLIRLNPDNFQYFNIAQFFKKQELEKMKLDQQFVSERLHALGCDLAAAHFIVFRGGAVKFWNHTDWIADDKNKKEYDDDLPNTYDHRYKLEAINLSGTVIIYEGFKNLENLRMLRWLSVAVCPHFDDWCLDRVSGEYGETLEYLDISYTNVTHHGLSALYKFEQLKTLKVHGLPENPDFLLTCKKLKQDFPELTIEGISFETLPREVEDKVLEISN